MEFMARRSTVPGRSFSALGVAEAGAKVMPLEGLFFIHDEGEVFFGGNHPRQTEDGIGPDHPGGYTN